MERRQMEITDGLARNKQAKCDECCSPDFPFSLGFSFARLPLASECELMRQSR